MKNNIILILVVTVISIAVIIISITVSLGGHDDEESSSGTSSQTSRTTASQQVTEPTTVTAEPTPQTEQSEPTTESGDNSEVTVKAAEDIIALARSLIGTDFADGGETPAGFDNSGFIYYVLRENGYITCPRGVSAQSQMGASVGYDELNPGDLVFFSEGGSVAEFGGLYVGSGTMIACLMPGTQVKEVDITSSYYTGHFFCGVRII